MAYLYADIEIYRAQLPPDTRTGAEREANRQRVAAWNKVWYSLTTAQQAAWHALSRAEKDTTYKMTAAEFAALMNPQQEDRAMQWKKTRLVVNVWQAGMYRITEDPEESPEQRFRLESYGDSADKELFATLKQAQHAAEVRNELAVVREDNERLRRELDERRQADAFEKSRKGHGNHGTKPTIIQEEKDDDGRDIPTERPLVESLAGALNAAIAQNASRPQLAVVGAGEDGGDITF